jgi:hypothetical protein
MSQLYDYPSLRNLHDDLARLDARLTVMDSSRRRARTRVIDGRDCALVEYGALRFWLDDAQRRVVAVLMEALCSASPDVDQRTLLRAAGVPGVRRLAEVFGGGAHPAWGTLVVPGRAAATYRLPDPPEVTPAQERRVVPDEG